MTDPLIYLASPYSDPSAEVREERFRAACKAAAELMRHRCLVFSPIAHTHPIALNGLPKGWGFWQRYDRRLLDACDLMVVLRLPGWEDSQGVQAEIRLMRELGKPVLFMEAPA